MPRLEDLRFQKLSVEPAPISIRAGPIDIPIIKSYTGLPSGLTEWTETEEQLRISVSQSRDSNPNYAFPDHTRFLDSLGESRESRFVGKYFNRTALKAEERYHISPDEASRLTGEKLGTKSFHAVAMFSFSTPAIRPIRLLFL
ncbi:hypothetical protein CQW23_03553 [Capsicum baccatum]|uniref:Uncharacterized protein n=1 Tax=Capsicum baccatum TaxID=33114 RepID=A0A2G2XC58_CAPBA|nr:hypothetical protein CQW23_03553 [Capsicum baccatum]